jgi:uncharacterized membrane protein YqaE (UPF0057 family)
VNRFLKLIFCFLFPPFAVLDNGCGAILLVSFLTLCGWVPGILGALVIFIIGVLGDANNE